MNLRGFKNLIRKMLCLPVYKTRAQINSVSIVDNNEPLVQIVETNKLKINKDPNTKLRKSIFPAMTDHKVRQSVYKKISYRK